MRSTVILIISLIGVFLVQSGEASDLHTTINIDVKEEWYNSGIYITSGDTLYLTGFGAFTAWQSADIWFNLATTAPFVGGENHTVPGYPAPAIIGKIGDTELFMASGPKAFVSEWEGPLYFTVNDINGGYADNTGVAIVKLRVYRGPSFAENRPDDPHPANIKLDQNRPNPFQTKTNIDFEIPSVGHVTVRIYNEAGQAIRTLVDKEMTTGTYSIPWEGKDTNGLRVPSGAYFYRVEHSGVSGSRQMIFIR